MSATINFIESLRSDIKTELYDDVLAQLAPKIDELLHRNIFTFKEAVSYLKVSDATLRRMVREEAIPHYRLRGAIFFRQWELNDYIDKLMIGKSKGKAKLAAVKEA